MKWLQRRSGPAQTDDQDFAAEWLALLHAERTDTGHAATAVLAITSLLAALLLRLRLSRLKRSNRRVT